jgi:uncharacterized membrane protein
MQADSEGSEQSIADRVSLSEHISQNIEAVVALHRQARDRVSPSQLSLERASRFVGRPAYLLVLLAFAAIWIVFNLVASHPFDPPPFQWLEGLLTLVALLTTTTVLIAQNRQVKLEQQAAHLDLQVSLVTEQKVTKLIHLLEELRRDIPSVRDRHDPQAVAMQEGVDTTQMAEALSEGGLIGGDEHKPAR